MIEPDDTREQHTDDTAERIVDRRGVLKLLGVPVALGSLAYLRQLGGSDDGSVPNWLEYAFSSRVQWAVDRTFHSRPVVADGTIYLRQDNRIHALATADGTEQWRAETADGPAHRFHIPLTVADGLVYEFARRDQLYALDAADGSERWTADLGDGASGPPTVAGDTVYIGVDETMYALDAADGSQRWAVDPPRDPSGSPAVVDDTVYMGGSNVHALDAHDGTERWSTEGGETNIRIRVSAHDNDSLLVHAGEEIYALDAADGTERWRADTSTLFRAPLAVADGTVYAPTREEWAYSSGSDGSLYAFDAASGDVQWQFTVAGGLSPPTIADGTVYGCSNPGNTGGRLYAIDATDGTERWSFPVSADAPTAADGTVYASGYSLYALDT